MSSSGIPFIAPVPYSGAVRNVDLGSRSIFVGNIGAGTTSPQKTLHVVMGAGSLPSLGSQVGLFQNNDAAASSAIFGIISGTGAGGTEWQGVAGFQFGDADQINRGLIYYKNGSDTLYLGTASSVTTGLSIGSNGNVGLGAAAPNAKLESRSTSEQARLSYDSTHYASFTVGGGGDLTIAPNGGDTNVTGTLTASGAITAAQFKLSALNSAPSSPADTGTLGEIRIVDGFIYVCVAANTWKRAELAAW